MKDKVSIIIPAFNQGSYLDETLKSIYHQTFENWECIIINDGSTDNTQDIALMWCDKDARFIYEFQVNQGLSAARNLGLKLASGDFIQFLDSDDYLDPEKLILSIEEFQLDRNCDVVLCDFQMFSNFLESEYSEYCDLKSKTFTLKSLLYQWDHEFTIPIHCALFRIQLFENFIFPSELKAKEDWVMWLWIFRNDTLKYKYVDKGLAYYRYHQENMSKDTHLLYQEKKKAIKLISTFLSPDLIINYLLVELDIIHLDRLKLRQTIKNYKDSKSYVFIEFLKNLYRLIKF